MLSLCFLLASCDRGASVQMEAARKLTDAVVRNDAIARDSMIATTKFKEYFTNTYVADEMLTWFRTIYDYHLKKFEREPTVDVDNDLRKQLDGALSTSERVEQTGTVKVKSPVAGEDDAIFWMVKQEGKPWKVAIVTRGEAQVNFR